MPKIGPLPEDIGNNPIDLTKHWSILDQTKADFKKSGRSGVVIIIDPDDEYRAKLAAFLAKYDTPCDVTKPQLVIEHDTQAKALYDLVRKAGLKAELILAGNEQA